MSRSLNRIQLIGNLTRDVELKYTPQGTAVCTFSVATNRGWTDSQGNKKDEATFHRIVAWAKLAEICAQYLGKGRKDRITILSDFVIPHLMDLKESKPSNNDYVFHSQARPNNHISKKTFQKILENASRKLGLDCIVTPYQLRHSFATHSLEDGTDIRHIQELMGHSSTKTTEIYTKVTKQRLLQIRSPLDNIKLDLTTDKDVKSNNVEVENVVKSN